MTGYLDWQSSLSLEQVFSAGSAFSYPTLVSAMPGVLLYLTAIKEEQGRSALMLFDGSSHTCITPPELNLRTKVNEYGGKPFWLKDQHLIFANQNDQCLYQQRISLHGATSPERLSMPASDATCMYTDVCRVTDDHLICIVEQAEHGMENRMSIASMSLSQPGAMLCTLIEGADFYSNLVVSPDRSQIAWVQWNHPHMPWDANTLCIAEVTFAEEAVIHACRRVPLQEGASVCQLLFASNGRLFFSADFPGGSGVDDFWNVFAYDPVDHTVTRVSHEQLEFGYPHWVYGDHRIVQVDEHTLLTVGSATEKDTLFRIDIDSYEMSAVRAQGCHYQQLNSDGCGHVTMVQRDLDSGPTMITGTLDGKVLQSRSLMQRNHRWHDISVAEHISYETQDGGTAHAFYYPPCNSQFQDQTDALEKPPLIVMVHGGPTARAYGYFDIQKQFWTSRGFALLDVNHRGSSGYGRTFRDALYQHWGEMDTRDIIDAIEAIVASGKADRERICIRGKSAGGYAVLRALTEYPQYFKAGACYYGIGNLVTLADVTHKFEKFYTDRLIDEVFEAGIFKAGAELPTDNRYVQRSPIHRIEQLQSAMIVFQGLLDKVVPPSVAQEVIDVLKSLNLPYQYVEYADEGHGFRQTENNIDAWRKELSFYQQHLVTQ